MKASITIKATRTLTSATILADGTLVKWFDIEERGTHRTLRTEIEVTEQYIHSITFRHPDYRNWQDMERDKQRFILDVCCRYVENSGYLPLLKDSRIYATFCTVSEGSQNTKDKGIAVGHVRVNNPKIGQVTFTNIAGLSSDVTPVLSADPRSTFAEIVETGYAGYTPVKITYRAEKKDKANAA